MAPLNNEIINIFHSLKREIDDTIFYTDIHFHKSVVVNFWIYPNHSLCSHHKSGYFYMRLNTNTYTQNILLALNYEGIEVPLTMLIYFS